MGSFAAFSRKSAVKTEKKTVQFSEDVQVETIEPEQEPVYIDEVRSLWCSFHCEVTTIAHCP